MEQGGLVSRTDKTACQEGHAQKHQAAKDGDAKEEAGKDWDQGSPRRPDGSIEPTCENAAKARATYQRQDVHDIYDQRATRAGVNLEGENENNIRSD